jgi:hypothetical protein
MRDGWGERGWFARLGRWRGWLLAAAIVVVLLLVGRGRISELLFPDPRLNRQLEQAQAALAKGVLTAPGGRGARELFEAVLAADPDQMTAQQGLVDVRNAAIIDAQRALDRRDTGRARDRLALAGELSAPAVMVQSLRARLHDQEEAEGSVPRLLQQAQAPGIDDARALALVARALQLEPANEQALDFRAELLSRRLVRADAAIGAGRIDEAQALVASVVSVDPGHLDLPPVQGRFGEALARRQAAAARALELARADERAGRHDAAARRYLALRAQGAEEATVQAGLDRAAAAVALRAQREAADFRFRAADASLAQARSWSPGSEAVLVAELHVRQSHQADRRLRKPPGIAERRRVDEAVTQARAAMDRGEFLAPPGTSAWDRLRVAMSLAPADPSVRATQRELATRSASCFEASLAGNHLRRAQECLETRLALEPGRGAPAADRRRLADRWMAFAEERLGASDWPAADSAITSARRWEPGDPRVRDLAARLHRARGATP